MKALAGMLFLLSPAWPVHAGLSLQTASSEAVALDALGAQLYSAGDYQDAEKKLREALAIEQAKSTPDPGTLSSIFYNLAAVARAQFRLPQSETLYQRAIALRETVSGPDSPELIRPLAGLALVYMAQGRIAPAMDSAERAVRVSTNHQDNLRQMAVAQNALATLLVIQGDSARAEGLEQKVVNELHRASATESREYVNALTNLGTSRLRLANYRQAEVDLREAEAVALRIAGPNHPITATIWNNLAKTRAAEGDWKDAERLFQRAVAAWRTSLGPVHPDVAYGLSNLATLYQSRKSYVAANRLFRQAIEIDEAALGADSLKVANDWSNLGALESVQHHYRDAESAISKALSVARKNVGFDHPDTARIAVNLAVVYYSQARYGEASGLFARALPVEERVLGPNSVEFASVLRIYASSLRLAHDYVDAERVELQAIGINTRHALMAEGDRN